MVITAAQLAATMPDASQLLSDEPEMESSLHYDQLALLVSCLSYLWRDRRDYFIGANLTIYYSREALRCRDFRGPDFFLVKNTEKRPRTSWVVWEENGQYPNLIIELLSPSTADVDRTTKKQLYQDRFRTPEYFWFSPDHLEFAGFRLEGGLYREISPTDQGWLWSQQLNLFLGIVHHQLRYLHPDGQLVPTPEEDALLAEQRGQLRKAQDIAANLLRTGMSEAQVAQITGLDLSQIQLLNSRN